MDEYLRCPAAHCTHRIAYNTAAASAIEQHLVDAHGLPEVSAAYQASLLLPIRLTPAA
jgi:hypothetical protein